MADPLRDAFYYLNDDVTLEEAQRIAAAIRAEIDKRITARGVPGGFEREAAKPQRAEPRECLCKYAIVQPDDGTTLHDKRCALATLDKRHGDDCIDDCNGCNCWCHPKPRRNPYADWETWGNENRVFTPRDLRKVRFQAWNEGAQIAGDRDE